MLDQQKSLKSRQSYLLALWKLQTRKFKETAKFNQLSWKQANPFAKGLSWWQLKDRDDMHPQSSLKCDLGYFKHAQIRLTGQDDQVETGREWREQQRRVLEVQVQWAVEKSYDKWLVNFITYCAFIIL